MLHVQLAIDNAKMSKRAEVVSLTLVGHPLERCYDVINRAYRTARGRSIAKQNGSSEVQLHFTWAAEPDVAHFIDSTRELTYGEVARFFKASGHSTPPSVAIRTGPDPD